MALHKQGEAALAKGEYVRAREMLERVRAHYAANGDAVNAAWTRYFIGMSYSREGDTRRASLEYQGCIVALREPGDNQETAQVLVAWATALSAHSEHDQALAKCAEALQILERMKETSTHRYAEARATLARSWFRRGRPDTALQEFARALEIHESLDPRNKKLIAALRSDRGLLRCARPARARAGGNRSGAPIPRTES